MGDILLILICAITFIVVWVVIPYMIIRAETEMEKERKGRTYTTSGRFYISK